MSSSTCHPKSTCSGRCCEYFYIGPGKGLAFFQKEAERAERLGHDNAQELRTVADMLIPLYVSRRVWVSPTGQREVSESHYFGCKHFDKETRLCKNYENRPEMCREYPGRLGGCSHSASCSYKNETYWDKRRAERPRMKRWDAPVALSKGNTTHG